MKQENKIALIGIIATISLMMNIGFFLYATDVNQKFENVNHNVNGMYDSLFRTMMDLKKMSCDQDFDIKIVNPIEDDDLIEALNEKGLCYKRIIVAEKIFDYQQHGIEPRFNDGELKILEEMLNSGGLSGFEELMEK